MKSGWKGWVVAASVGLSLALGAGAASAQTVTEIIKRGKARIGVLIGAPPYGMVDPRGNPIGYDADVAAAIGKYMGVPIEMVGLTPSAQGGRIRLSGGKVSVTDGPFTESKELVGGYAIFEVASKAEAMKLGSQFVQLHADVMGPDYEMEVELRELYAPPGR